MYIKTWQLSLLPIQFKSMSEEPDVPKDWSRLHRS